jgi:chemotaxis signal transduction protein
LLVDEVHGAKQLLEENRLPESGNVTGALEPYVSGRFDADGEKWVVFDVSRILSDPRFSHAAA